MGSKTEEQIPAWVKESRIGWAKGDAIRDEGLKEPETVKVFKSISYGPFGEANLLDVYRPKEAEGSLPLLINVHGGGFFYGDKELYRFYAMDMATYGFAVINMNYRLSPENHFPAPLEDIHAVMGFAKEHAEEYGFDLTRIFMMGDSAGAQLTSHYAAINSNPGFAALYGLKPLDLKIKGISLACGLYDLPASVLQEQKDKPTENMMENYLADAFDSKGPRLDVLGAITADYPDTYVFSCPNDFLYENCRPMADLINARGARAVARIYGTKEMTDVAHVFHCNMKTDIGREARKDQAEFLLAL